MPGIYIDDIGAGNLWFSGKIIRLRLELWGRKNIWQFEKSCQNGARQIILRTPVLLFEFSKCGFIRCNNAGMNRLPAKAWLQTCPARSRQSCVVDMATWGRSKKATPKRSGSWTCIIILIISELPDLQGCQQVRRPGLSIGQRGRFSLPR